MPSPLAFYRWSELDRATYPELRDRVLSFEEEGFVPEHRSYPGYRQFPLGRARPRLLAPIDKVLQGRRCARSLEARLPPRRALGHILRFAHGITGKAAAAPFPPRAGSNRSSSTSLTFVAPGSQRAFITTIDRGIICRKFALVPTADAGTIWSHRWSSFPAERSSGWLQGMARESSESMGNVATASSSLKQGTSCRTSASFPPASAS